MGIGWLGRYLKVYHPHGLCNGATVNTPAISQIPIALVVRFHSKKRKNSAQITQDSTK